MIGGSFGCILNSITNIFFKDKNLRIMWYYVLGKAVEVVKFGLVRLESSNLLLDVELIEEVAICSVIAEITKYKNNEN